MADDPAPRSADGDGTRYGAAPAEPDATCYQAAPAGPADGDATRYRNAPADADATGYTPTASYTYRPKAHRALP